MSARKDADDYTQHVDQRLRKLIAEQPDGVVERTYVANKLNPQQRRYLPVVLASGAYDLSVEPGGLTIRLRGGAK